MTIRRLCPESTTEPIDSFTVVVDGRDLSAGNAENDSLQPREQLEILQKMVKIQKIEGWEVWVLFVGDPLPQVDHGGDFLGLRVFFAPTAPQRVPTLLECARVLAKSGEHSLLVSNDADLESKALELGASVLRAQSLKKAHETLFTVRSRPQSRLMRHRTVDQRKDRLDRDDDDRVNRMIDVVD